MREQIFKLILNLFIFIKQRLSSLRGVLNNVLESSLIFSKNFIWENKKSIIKYYFITLGGIGSMVTIVGFPMLLVQLNISEQQLKSSIEQNKYSIAELERINAKSYLNFNFFNNGHERIDTNFPVPIHGWVAVRNIGKKTVEDWFLFLIINKSAIKFKTSFPSYYYKTPLSQNNDNCEAYYFTYHKKLFGLDSDTLNFYAEGSPNDILKFDFIISTSTLHSSSTPIMALVGGGDGAELSFKKISIDFIGTEFKFSSENKPDHNLLNNFEEYINELSCDVIVGH